MCNCTSLLAVRCGIVDQLEVTVAMMTPQDEFTTLALAERGLRTLAEWTHEAHEPYSFRSDSLCERTYSG